MCRRCISLLFRLPCWIPFWWVVRRILGLLESPTAEDMKIAEQALETMGIYQLKDKVYTQISGGERQMVIFARVLAQQPSLLLLDEPTSHLDFGNQIRLLHEVKKLSATGLPIIMTSHFPDQVFMVSTMVAIMKDGAFIRLRFAGRNYY